MTVEETFQRVTVLLRMNELGQAETLLRSLIDRQPDLTLAHVLLGIVFERAERYEDARDQLLRAVELDDENCEAYNNLGVVYKNFG